MRWVVCAWLAGASALCACDVQPSGGYEGEPLLALGGTIENQLATPPDHVKLVLLWYVSGWSVGPSGDLPPDFVPWSPTPVSGTFPSDFMLDVFVPPPKNDLFDFTKPADQGDLMALAQIAAIDPDQHKVLGVVLDHVVAYLPQTAQHNGIYTRAGTPAGYHLEELPPPTCGVGPGWQEVDPATDHLSMVLGGPLIQDCPP
jgi:hypothetical protein